VGGSQQGRPSFQKKCQNNPLAQPQSYQTPQAKIYSKDVANQINTYGPGWLRLGRFSSRPRGDSNEPPPDWKLKWTGGLTIERHPDGRNWMNVAIPENLTFPVRHWVGGEHIGTYAGKVTTGESVNRERFQWPTQRGNSNRAIGTQPENYEENQDPNENGGFREMTTHRNGWMIPAFGRVDRNVF